MNRRRSIVIVLIVVFLLSFASAAYRSYENNPSVVRERFLKLLKIIPPVSYSANSIAGTLFKEEQLRIGPQNKKAFFASEVFIKYDYPSSEMFYKNKDRIYFIYKRYGAGRLYPELLFLDKKSLQYYIVDVSPTCDNDFEKTKPIFIDSCDWMIFFGGPLRAVNLDTNRQYIVKHYKEEDLGVGILGHRNSNYSSDIPDITYLDGEKIKIGVYKNPDGMYPYPITATSTKVRDEVIDISSLY